MADESCARSVSIGRMTAKAVTRRVLAVRCCGNVRFNPHEIRVSAQGDAGELATCAPPRLQFNQHLTHPGDIVFRHACRMGLEGIVSKRLGPRYVSGRSKDWLKFKNPEAPAVKREAEEEWGPMIARAEPRPANSHANRRV